jgi:hypothetical protein
MFKVALTAAATAAVCFAIAAATGLGAAAPKVVNLKLNEIVSLKSGNFHCQVLAKTQIACGANTLKNAVQVYFTPHALGVIKFNAAGTKGSLLYSVKR